MTLLTRPSWLTLTTAPLDGPPRIGAGTYRTHADALDAIAADRITRIALVERRAS